jgi:hypothetical protein
MEQSSGRLRGFFKVLSNNAAWVLAGLLFVACVLYLLSFYPNALTDWNALKTRQAFVEQAAGDTKLVEQAQGTVGSLLNALKDAHIGYADFSDAVNQNQKLPSSDVIAQTTQKISDAKTRSSSSIQAVESARSSSADVNAYARQLAAELKTYPPRLDQMAKTMQLAQHGDQAGVLAQVAAQTPMMNQWPPALQKTARMAAGFSGILPLDQQTQSTAAQLLQADRKQFMIGFYLSLAAVLYMMVFAVLLGRKLVRGNRTEQVRPVRAAKGRRRKR